MPPWLGAHYVSYKQACLPLRRPQGGAAQIVHYRYAIACQTTSCYQHMHSPTNLAHFRFRIQPQCPALSGLPTSAGMLRPRAMRLLHLLQQLLSNRNERSHSSLTNTNLPRQYVPVQDSSATLACCGHMAPSGGTHSCMCCGGGRRTSCPFWRSMLIWGASFMAPSATPGRMPTSGTGRDTSAVMSCMAGTSTCASAVSTGAPGERAGSWVTAASQSLLSVPALQPAVAILPSHTQAGASCGTVHQDWRVQGTRSAVHCTAVALFKLAHSHHLDFSPSSGVWTPTPDEASSSSILSPPALMG